MYKVGAQKAKQNHLIKDQKRSKESILNPHVFFVPVYYVLCLCVKHD